MTALFIAGFAGCVIAWAASRLVRRGLAGDLRTCMVAQMLAMLVRAAGLAVVALGLHIAAPGEVRNAICVTVGVLLLGLALDVRGQLRTLRTHTEDPARA